VSQRVRRNPIGQPGQFGGHVAGAIELARRAKIGPSSRATSTAVRVSAARASMAALALMIFVTHLRSLLSRLAMPLLIVRR